MSIIIAFSIPKEYTSTVVMAPEFSSGASASSGLSALASMAGFNIGGMSGSEDALYPELYPQIISSTPFLCDLMSLQVENKDGDLSTTLYKYLDKHQKKTWWSKAIKAPIKMVKRMIGPNVVDTIMPTNGADMNLTRKQYLLLQALNDKIAVSVDKGNFVITLNVTMQDPKIAAYVASVVADKLQEYIGTLMEVGDLAEFDIDNDKVYSLTASGEETLGFFADKIPYSIREKLTNCVNIINKPIKYSFVAHFQKRLWEILSQGIKSGGIACR